MGSRADAANPMTKIDAIIAERDAEIAALRQQVAELQAWKDAVPVDALRYIVYDCDIRYAEGADDVIRKWLKEE